MAVRITIDIFSGRPNPVIELDDREANRVVPRLKSAAAKDERAPATLGFRGLIVETTSDGKVSRFLSLVPGRSAARAAVATRRVNEFVAEELITEERLGADLAQLLRQEIVRAQEFPRPRAVGHSRRPVRSRPCPCGPLYEPAWWNDGGQRQFNNNCYNYASNYRTDTFAQPGRAAGAMYSALTCASVLPAAQKDDLIADPQANNRCPREGHLVALVIWPGVDFHWYRKGRDGYWTHKPGGTPATNVDNSGAVITDPRMANRGGYTDFCTFMVVMHGHIKIS